MSFRNCRRCGRSTRADFFSNSHSGVCLHCAQDLNRERKTNGDAYRRKALGSRRGHARKYKVTIKEMETRHHWSSERIARDLKACSTCCYCQREMGIEEKSLDVVDPEKPPCYRTNVKICCISCNVEKGTMSPRRWSELLADRQMWLVYINEKKNIQLVLFETA